jgi:hypothetical protein
MFDEAPKGFDAVEMWAVGRQEQEPQTSATPFGSAFFDCASTMQGAIVENQHRGAFEGGQKILFHGSNKLGCTHSAGLAVVAKAPIAVMPEANDIEAFAVRLGGQAQGLTFGLPQVRQARLQTEPGLVAEEQVAMPFSLEPA